jgi:hypothetical protein
MQTEPEIDKFEMPQTSACAAFVFPLCWGFMNNGVGEALFWFLVVIVTIIIQAVRAVKQNNGDSPQETSSQSDELQDFLKSLGAEQSQNPKASAGDAARNGPPQTSRAATAPAKTRPPPATGTPPGHGSTEPSYRKAAERYSRREKYAPSVAGKGEEPSVIEKTELQVKGSRPAKVQTAMSMTSSPVTGTVEEGEQPETGVMEFLRNRKSLQQAIVLREILGPPTALRH